MTLVRDRGGWATLWPICPGTPPLTPFRVGRARELSSGRGTEALCLAVGAMPGLRMVIPLWVASSPQLLRPVGPRPSLLPGPRCVSPSGWPRRLHLPCQPSKVWQSTYTWPAFPVTWPNSSLGVQLPQTCTFAPPWSRALTRARQGGQGVASPLDVVGFWLRRPGW